MKPLIMPISLALMLLCGCSTPVPQHAVRSLQERERRTEDGSCRVGLAPPSLSPSQKKEPVGQAPLYHFSLQIPKLTLERAFALAEELHPELALARARIEAAQGRIEQAGLLPNPEAVARMESAPLDGSTTSEAEYVAGVSQGLPLGGRLAAASRVERLERERRVKELEARRMEIRARAQGAFATALYTEQVIDVQNAAIEVANHGVAIAKARLAAGDAVPEEEARAQMELVRARVELERARSLHAQALVALVGAIGDPALRLESVEGSLDIALEVPALEALSARLSESPFVAAAEAETAVQHARVELAEARRIPDVNLDLFYRRLEHSQQNAFDIGVAIPLALFDRSQGTLRETRADVAAAQAQARSQRNQSAQRLQEAHARLVSALAQARTLREEILPRSQTILDAAEARYAAGDSSLADVLPVRRDRTAVHLAYLESLRDVMEAWANLSLSLPTQ